MKVDRFLVQDPVFTGLHLFQMDLPVLCLVVEVWTHTLDQGDEQDEGICTFIGMLLGQMPQILQYFKRDCPQKEGQVFADALRDVTLDKVHRKKWDLCLSEKDLYYFNEVVDEVFTWWINACDPMEESMATAHLEHLFESLADIRDAVSAIRKGQKMCPKQIWDPFDEVPF